MFWSRSSRAHRRSCSADFSPIRNSSRLCSFRGRQPYPTNPSSVGNPNKSRPNLLRRSSSIISCKGSPSITAPSSPAYALSHLDLLRTLDPALALCAISLPNSFFDSPQPTKARKIHHSNSSPAINLAPAWSEDCALDTTTLPSDGLAVRIVGAAEESDLNWDRRSLSIIEDKPSHASKNSSKHYSKEDENKGSIKQTKRKSKNKTKGKQEKEIKT